MRAAEAFDVGPQIREIVLSVNGEARPGRGRPANHPAGRCCANISR